ncbi:MAG: hypothetical protein OEZ47_14875 [Gammaproteobacteria bacterium]|nr:hypothetical protein [Gammaproteobacteria bacterium]
MKKKLSPGLVIFFLFCFFSLSVSAQALLPADTKSALILDNSNGLSLMDPDGNKLTPCNLCTTDMEAQYGAHCENAPSTVRLCEGLTKSTVQDVQTITLIKSHKNPHCIFWELNGVWFSWPSPCVH